MCEKNVFFSFFPNITSILPYLNIVPIIVKPIFYLFLITQIISLTACKTDTERILPIRYTVQGIDVSHHQGKIRWDTIAAQNIQFAFMKATEGRRHIDTMFGRNWAESKRVKIKRGAYHFFRPSLPPEEQARNYINTVILEYGDLPPVIDVEVTDNMEREEIVKQLKEFLQLIKAEYNIQPIIYTPYQFYNKYLAAEFKDYPLWIGHYSKNEPQLAAGVEWIFWQYGERGRLRGIRNSYVDLNVFNGTLDELQQMCLSGALLSQKNVAHTTNVPVKTQHLKMF
jgi:lysozyme